MPDFLGLGVIFKRHIHKLIHTHTHNLTRNLGDNLLAVVRHIAGSEVLADTHNQSEGGVVFFDFLGLWLVYYPVGRIGGYK